MGLRKEGRFGLPSGATIPGMKCIILVCALLAAQAAAPKLRLPRKRTTISASKINLFAFLTSKSQPIKTR